MSFIETLLVITGGLCIGLIVALVQAHKYVNRVEHKNETLAADLAELRAKMKENAENFLHAANQLRAHYEEYIDGHQKEVARAKWAHSETGKMFLEFTKEMDRQRAEGIWSEAHNERLLAILKRPPQAPP